MTEVIKLVPFEERRGPSLISRCASEIEPEPIEWIWPGRNARGKHTCIAGEPGTGKSQLTMAIVATVTMGGEWPCGEGRSPQGSVIILSAEDGAADTIVPRLHAAGADLGRVQLISAVRERDGKGRRAFSLQADLAPLEKEIERLGDVALVIIDPVSSYLGKTDSHKNAEVRGVLEPIGEMAERLRVAILSVTHFSKSGSGAATKALHRFIGSIAFVGAPRAAFAVIEDSENRDRRLLLHAKNNLAAPPQGLAFTLEESIVGEAGKGIVASRVRFELDPVVITANEALAAEASGGSGAASEEAEEFLQELLAGGPVPAKQVKFECEGAGLSWATIRRAKDRLGIKPQKDQSKDGGWLWGLNRRCSTSPREHLEHLEHLRRNPPFSDGYVSTCQKTAEIREDAQDAHPLKVSTFDPIEHLPTDTMPDLPDFLDRRASR